MSDVDTTKSNTTEIRHLSLCAGYGGIDLGLQRVLPDCRTVTYVEIETFAIWNLVKKMETGVLHPAPIWTDLKTMPLGQLRKILGRNSLISGGFPCQPFSAAGQHKGDEDPRHLFPYIKNAIKVIRPRWVFLENVEGIISSKLKGDNWTDPAGTPVLLHVLRELERLGYRSTAGLFSAAEVGLPHQRKRVFILAHNISKGLERHVQDFGAKRWKDEGRYVARCSESAPARSGEQQYQWEPPRVILGNSDTGRQLQQERNQPEGRGWHSHTGKEEPELGDTQSLNGKGQAGGHREASTRGTSSASDQRQVESQMGGDTDGSTCGLDYAQLCSSVDNRTDELRLLGNGVVPATAAKAWIILNEKLNAQQ